MEQSQSIGPWSTMPPPAWPGLTSRRAPSPVFFARPRAGPSSFLPSGYEGDGAPGGAAVVGSISASPSKMRKRLPARRPNSLMPGLICGRLLPFALSRNGSAPGRFPFGGLPVVPAVRMAPCGPPFTSGFPASGKAPLPSASSWQAAHIGHQAEPRRRPECLGGAFVSRPRAPHPAPSSDAS